MMNDSSSERLVLAARALRAGDPIAALNYLSGFAGAHALALRGIALAQLSEFHEARKLLKQAGREFTRSGAALDRARVLAALAELTAADRELRPAIKALDEVAHRLEDLEDLRNASWARLVLARLLLLDRRPTEALELIDLVAASVDRRDPVLALTIELARAETMMRLVQVTPARRALARASGLSQIARNRLLSAEVARLQDALDGPIARLHHRAEPVSLADLEALYREPVVVDGLSRRLLINSVSLGLQRRPVLFKLLAELARSWPSAIRAEQLISTVFASQRPNESHRARLRVELSRLRRIIAPNLKIVCDGKGWRLEESHGVPVRLVEPLDGSASAALLALLSDGAAWSTRNLAQAMRRSARTVQRALRSLREGVGIREIGRGRGCRWALDSPSGGIATQMLLLGLYQPDYEGLAKEVTS